MPAQFKYRTSVYVSRCLITAGRLAMQCDVCLSLDASAAVPSVEILSDLMSLLGEQVFECAATLVLCSRCSELAGRAATFVREARRVCLRLALLAGEVKQEAVDSGEDNAQQYSSDEEIPLRQLKAEKRREEQDSKPVLSDIDRLPCQKKKKKRKRSKQLSEAKGDSAKTEQAVSEHSRPRREGRRVVETEQYVVIRLTVDQVRDEMAERAKSERYTSAAFRCERCVRGFNYREVLDAHKQKHDSNNGAYQCELCKIYCPSEVSIRGHMKSHTTRYACKECGVVKLSRQHLLEHHALTHASAGGYTCAQCGFSCEHRNTLQRHMRTHAARSPVICSYCDRHFKTRETLKVHTYRHTNPGLYACTHCPRRYPTPGQLRVHKLTHTETRSYTHYCVECDVRFATRSALSKHLSKARPHRNDTHSCSTCNKTFGSRNALSVHLAWAHEGRRDHACSLCARAYGTRDGLRAHVRKAHTSNGTVHKPTPCNYCHKMFKSRETLTKHLRTHTGERPYECGECGQKFAQSGTRSTHIRIVHKKLSRRVRTQGQESISLQMPPAASNQEDER